MLSSPYSLSLFGGVQAQVLGLARALRSRGVDARVIAPCDGPPPEPGVTSIGPSTRVPSNGSVAPLATGRAVAARTIEAIRTFEPDVLHLHEPFSPGANHAALVGTAVPVVGTFHSARPGRNPWYQTFRSPLKGLLRRLTISTAVSEQAARQIALSFDTECEILPNGVDIDQFAKGDTVDSERPAVCFIGRLEPRKGVAQLLDAFARLDREAVLWVAGDGPELARLRARDVRDVEWLGRISQEEKAMRLRSATVACFPAIDGESFGIVLLEAMAAGAPVVASDIDGYRDVARDGQEAILVEPKDPEGLADALRTVLDDRDAREAMAAAGRARADEFSMDRLAESFVEVYERAIVTTRVP
ncbi:MAG TPA: glycosyltransferase family 4 protein [Acidimicrobiia bacterium]|jgi:phosphatidylinositol alpha-mannosyltransferase